MHDAAPPQAAPIGQINVTTVFRYVLILEWLESGDLQTGLELHGFLAGLGMPSRLVQCHSAEDVRLALVDALANLGERGIPAVHLETHAEEPDGEQDLQFGTNAAPGVAWFEFGDWLAPLNVASDFRLMVMGAACFGLGVMAAMKVYAHAAPFAICIGMTTSVTAGTLRDAMFEFYRSLGQGEGMHEAVANSNRQLHQPNEELRMTSSPMLAYMVCRGVYDGYRTPTTMEKRIAGLLERARLAGMPIPDGIHDSLPRMLHAKGRDNMQAAWNAWFPPELQARAPDYRFNYDLIEAQPPLGGQVA